MSKVCITTAIIFLFGSVTFGQSMEWESRKNKDGIKVFTRNVENSGFKEFKAEMTVPCSMHKAVYVIKDSDNACDWLHNCKSSEMLKKESELVQYNYSVTHMPFPFDDRDMVFKMESKPGDSVYVIYVSGVSGYVPEKKGIIRMDVAEGSWVIKQNNDETLHISYSMYVEPGGSLPSWLVNTKITEIPYETLSKLRDLVLTD